ncbi:carbohydrate-binding protein [Kitasatospora xanthocidica]|uniref:Carbohydrate-binding protein n=1 Tax=Kitasatospora xanthocidica TaxID=83382 RepID=A0A372ZPQ2_9ACTN|nr:AMP-binding protein [Kitasatospora xanthocidica]RGD57452.1 carbohydrate-binding protein [Kitasatospora xanthocidica]
MMQQPSLVGSFVSHATDHPCDPALVWHGEETTYRELHRAAERERLRIARLAPDGDEPIGIPAAKSPSTIALVLACLLEGRRFLLLPAPVPEGGTSPAPAERAGIRHVLSPEDPGPDARERPAEPKPPRTTEPADVSFMFTTSGSTGRPKIVPLSTGAVDRFTTWAGERFGIRRGTTVLNYAPLTFDLCLLDIWATLKHGGRVVLVDPARATQPGHLLDLLSRHEVQLVQAVPMFYQLLVDATAQSGRRLDTVEHVVFTGDSLPARCLAELPRLFPGARLHNVYGCTETNDSFLHEVDGTEPPDGPVPIGRPLPGVHAVIVGADGAIVTGPGTGELHVATPFQTDGYLDRAQDAGRFATHHHDGETRRYFRSGDLVRRDEDGRVTLEGRNDHQVKVRGTRVNTHEVEQVLLDHPEVVEAAVVAVPDPVAGRLLRGLVRRAPDSRLNSLALRRHCAQRLPLTAVPSTLRIVDDPLPRTSTGKIDRAPVERACSPSQPTEGTAT